MVLKCTKSQNTFGMRKSEIIKLQGISRFAHFTRTQQSVEATTNIVENRIKLKGDKDKSRKEATKAFNMDLEIGNLVSSCGRFFRKLFMSLQTKK